MGNMCMRLRNAGKGEASPSLFPCFAPNTHMIYNLPMQTVHFTTNVVNSNHARVEVYSIQHYLIKVVSDLMQVGFRVICVWGLETREKARLRRAFSRVSRRIHIFTYMLRQCTCTLYLLSFKATRLCKYRGLSLFIRGRRGRDRMVVGFTTTYADSAFHH
jgi:hypothetical protein